MSSIVTGKRIDRATLPVTWAAMAAVLQVLVLLIPGAVKAGSLEARMAQVEKSRDEAATQTVQRREFEKLYRETVRKDQFAEFSARVLESLARIEKKQDR